MTKIEKLHRRINDKFSECLREAFKVRFRRNLTTEYSILSMQLVSFPSNGKPFTSEQKKWVQAFEIGFMSAHDLVTEEAHE